MRKCIEAPVSRAAIIYVGLMVNLRFRIWRKGWGNLGEGGEKVTDKVVLTAYVVWFITSIKDCHWYSR